MLFYINSGIRDIVVLHQQESIVSLRMEQTEGVRFGIYTAAQVSFDYKAAKAAE